LRTRVYARRLDRITNVFRFRKVMEIVNKKIFRFFFLFILLRFAWVIPSFILIGKKKKVWCDQMAWINYGLRMIMIVDMGIEKHILNKRKHDVCIIMTMTTSKQREISKCIFFSDKINDEFYDVSSQTSVYWFLSIIIIIIIIISDICCEIYTRTVDSSGKLVRFFSFIVRKINRIDQIVSWETQ
jgi:hypothetical protein